MCHWCYKKYKKFHTQEKSHNNRCCVPRFDVKSIRHTFSVFHNFAITVPYAYKISLIYGYYYFLVKYSWEPFSFTFKNNTTNYSMTCCLAYRFPKINNIIYQKILPLEKICLAFFGGMDTFSSRATCTCIIMLITWREVI